MPAIACPRLCWLVVFSKMLPCETKENHRSGWEWVFAGIVFCVEWISTFTATVVADHTPLCSAGCGHDMRHHQMGHVRPFVPAKGFAPINTHEGFPHSTFATQHTASDTVMGLSLGADKAFKIPACKDGTTQVFNRFPFHMKVSPFNTLSIAVQLEAHWFTTTVPTPASVHRAAAK